MVWIGMGQKQIRSVGGKQEVLSNTADEMTQVHVLDYQSWPFLTCVLWGSMQEDDGRMAVCNMEPEEDIRNFMG